MDAVDGLTRRRREKGQGHLIKYTSILIHMEYENNLKVKYLI